MQDTGWDRALRVTGDGQGLGGHAGAVLMRTLAAQAGLTAALGAALRGPESPRWRPGHRAGVHCALGAASMTGIALLGPPCPGAGCRTERHDGADDAGAG